MISNLSSKSKITNIDNKQASQDIISYGKPQLDEISPNSFFEYEGEMDSLEKQISKTSHENSQEAQFEKELAKIEYIFNNYKTLDINQNQTFEYNNQQIDLIQFEILKSFIANDPKVNLKARKNVRQINALTLFNYRIYKEFGVNSTFMKFKYKTNKTVKSNEQGEIPVLEYDFEIIPENLANYLYAKEYNEYAIMSKMFSNSDEPYYYYNVKDLKWGFITEKALTQLIRKHVRNIIIFFNVDKQTQLIETITKNILNQIETHEELHSDMLEEYSTNNPYWVQFKDIVYDMKNDKFARMNKDFKLAHYHDYSIPTGYAYESEISKENGFVDIALTDEELKDNCPKILERLKLLHHESELTFIQSLIGSFFCHSNKDWQVLPIIIGEGGNGKSMIYDTLVSDYMIGTKNKSGVDQKGIEKGSDFLLSSMYGKEMNIISETNGSYLSEEIIRTFKAINDTTTINPKYKQSFTAKLYCTFLIMGNVEQIPAIPPSYVNDSGFKRRVVLIKCKPTKEIRDFEKEKGQSFSKYFDFDEMKKEIPYFALLCMRTFINNLGNIATFMSSGGANGDVIEGFTTEKICNDTKRYFNDFDRDKEFMREFIHYYKVGTNKVDNNKANEKDFIAWVANLSAKEILDQYVKWYETNYPHITVFPKKFTNYLSNVHNIENVRKRPLKINKYGDFVQDSKAKQFRTFGLDFAKLVIETIREGLPEDYFKNNDTNNEKEIDFEKFKD